MSATPALRIASLGLLASLCALSTACKETSISEVPVDVVRIDLSASTVTVDVGSTASVTATPKSGSGQSLTARTVQFSSSNPSVAAVTASGNTVQITGASAGTATITATSGGVSGTVSVTVRIPNLTLNIENHLYSPVVITVNGSQLGQVGARTLNATQPTLRTFQIPGTAQFTLEWDLVRPVIQNTTTPIGEAMGGLFNVTVETSTTFDFAIDNDVGGTVYFAPLITNNTTARLLMGVNFGRAEENRCNCVVPAFSSDIYLGYYRLFPDTEIRGYNDGSNYTGNWVFWTGTQVNAAVGVLTGLAPLVTNVTPAPGGVAVPSLTSARMPAALNLPVRSTGRDDVRR